MNKIEHAADLLIEYPLLREAWALSQMQALLMAYQIGHLAGEICQLEKRALERDLEEFEQVRGRA